MSHRLGQRRRILARLVQMRRVRPSSDELRNEPCGAALAREEERRVALLVGVAVGMDALLDESADACPVAREGRLEQLPRRLEPSENVGASLEHLRVGRFE